MEERRTGATSPALMVNSMNCTYHLVVDEGLQPSPVESDDGSRSPSLLVPNKSGNNVIEIFTSLSPLQYQKQDPWTSLRTVNRFDVGSRSDTLPTLTPDMTRSTLPVGPPTLQRQNGVTRAGQARRCQRFGISPPPLQPRRQWKLWECAMNRWVNIVLVYVGSYLSIIL